MQIWQPVQFSRKFSTLTEPGGEGILLRGSDGSSEYGDILSFEAAEFLPAAESFFAAEQSIAPSGNRPAANERLGILKSFFADSFPVRKRPFSSGLPSACAWFATQFSSSIPSRRENLFLAGLFSWRLSLCSSDFPSWRLSLCSREIPLARTTLFSARAFSL